MSSKSPGMSLRASSKGAGPTPTKRRNSTLWSESLDVHQKSTFSTKEIKRQEVERRAGNSPSGHNQGVQLSAWIMRSYCLVCCGLIWYVLSVSSGHP